MPVEFPNIDPVMFELGPIKLHWYGAMYLVGFLVAWALGMYRAGRAHTTIEKKHVEDIIFYSALGVVIGGRVGYVVFYNFGQFLQDPVWLFRVWEGGMSFHGGVLGGIFFLYLLSRKIKRPLWEILDFTAPLCPMGIGLVRLTNFINQELWGRPTTVPWGMVFPNDTLGLVRHPSQLYESFLEGLVLFLILFFFSRKRRPPMMVTGLAIGMYGVFRFTVEFFREPDAHIGIDAFGWMTRGQILSSPMIVIGFAIVLWGAFYYKSKTERAGGGRL